MSLVLGMILDALLGEPRALWERVPHPAVLMGRAVSWCDARLNRGAARRLKGAVSVLVLTALAAAVGWAISAAGWPFEAVATAALLAQRSLVEHVRAVAAGLRMSPAEGRRAVARIVGRDVRALDAPGVARAAIESAAENFSDAVVAPVFWFVLAGLPGLLACKMINTADSMIGYRSERHRDFGWAAARLDDVMNLVPARYAALVLAALGGQLHAWRAIASDAARHRSPNAGWPEAAMARSIGVALSGPRSYGGVRLDEAWVNPRGDRAPGPAAIETACGMLWRGWAALLGMVILWALL